MGKIALKIGSKPINFILLLVGCAIAYFGLNSYYQTEQKQRLSKSQQAHQQQAQIINSVLKTHIAGLQTTLKAVASNADIKQPSFSYGKYEEITEQPQLLSFFPGANKVCIANSNFKAPQQTDCLDISFATLNSLRQAEQNGIAPIAIMKVGTEQAHLLLAHKLEDKYQSDKGVLLVTYPSSFVKQLLPSSISENAYVEIQQGSKRIATVLSRGNVSFKQTSPVLQQNIDGSYLKLAYWSEPASIMQLPWHLLLMIFGSIVLCWLLRDFWSYYLIKIDSKTLSKQINDLKVNKMKPDYSLANKVLDDVKDDIRSIAYEKKVAKPIAVANTETQTVSSEAVVEELAELPVFTLHPELFGSYDIRETKDIKLDAQTVRLVGTALGSEAKDQGQQSLIVARDERHISEQLVQALIEGIQSSGCAVIDVGAVAIPLFYFACEKSDSSSGVMVTTSQLHQSVTSIKCVINKRALTEDAIRGLYTRIEQKKLHSGSGAKQSKAIADVYLKAVTENVSVARSVRVVIDCGNTITSLIAPKLFSALGCDVVELNCELGGALSHSINPSQAKNLDELIEGVRRHDAELGIAFDSDGDRLAVVDSNGDILSADRILVLLAQGVLIEDPTATILYDVKSTRLIEDVAARSGGNPVIAPSGYNIMKNKAYGVSAKLAGEYSGHIYFNDRWFGFEDALYSAARLLEFIAKDPLERSASEVFSALPKRYATEEILVDIGDNDSSQFISELQNQADFEQAKLITVDGLRVEFPDAWGVVRVSNTQRCLSLRFEANNQQALENIQQQFRQQLLQVKPTLGLSF